MAEYVLSYPFHIDTVNRRANVVYSDTDTYKAQQVKAFLRTHREERSIMPQFGIEEPTFHVFDTGAFFDDFNKFYSAKDIKIEQITLSEVSGAVKDVTIEFK